MAAEHDAHAPSPRERLFDANAFVGRAVHLATMVVEPPFDSDLWEFLTEDAFDVIAEQLGTTADTLDVELSTYGHRTRDREEALSEILSMRLDGWLVQIDQATFEPHPGKGSCSVRGGWRQRRTFYAATYVEALDAGLTWAEERLDEAMEASK